MWLSVAWAATTPPPQTAEAMDGHFQDATVAMLSVALCDLQGARDAASDLARDKTTPTPLRAPARAVVRAKTVEDAATAVGALGRACAECHTIGGRGPKPHNTEAVPGTDPVDKHIMAATFVWMGLVTPMEQPFEVGLKSLLPPLSEDDNDATARAAEQFSEWANEARGTKSWDERAAVFGRMLQACADCHTIAGVHKTP